MSFRQDVEAEEDEDILDLNLRDQQEKETSRGVSEEKSFGGASEEETDGGVSEKETYESAEGESDGNFTIQVDQVVGAIVSDT